MSCSHRPQSSPPSPPTLIEIPAHEFNNLPASPSRTPTRLPNKPSPNPVIYRHRQQEAAAAREAALQTIHHRAKHHVLHAVAVAQDVKQAREATVARREAALQSALHNADQRRARLRANRAAALSERRAQHTRRLRDHLRRVKEADEADGAHAEQEAERQREAERRRGQILSDRRLRAARFSPPRLAAPEPTNSDRMTDASSPPGTPLTHASAWIGVPAVSGDAGALRSVVLPTTPVTPGPSRRKVFRRFPDSDPSSGDNTERVRKAGSRDERTSAAEKIAGCYLLSRARIAMTQAGVLGPQLGEYEFTDTTARLESDEAQRAADMVFRALGMRDLGRRHTRRDIIREKSERRVLLSCLLLALHPDAVVEDKVRATSRMSGDVASVDCVAVCAARRMLLCLQVGTLGSIGAAWVRWRRAFLIWKKKDAENFLKAMIEDAVATEALRLTIDNKFLEVENLDTFRSTLGVEDPVAELHRKEHAVWKEQLSLKQETIRDAVVKLAGPAGTQRLDAALAASRRINDEHLVHEIMLDLPGLLAQMQQSCALPDVVWERLRADLSSKISGRSELAARLAHIARALNSMVPGCFVLSNEEVPGELDMEFAVSIVARVTESLERCQSQAFDSVVREWKNEAICRLRSSGTGFCDIVVEVLKELTELVRQVQVDVLSFRIRHSAPIVQQFGAAWERSRFQGHTISGTFDSSLPRTRCLLSESLQSFRATAPALRKELTCGSQKAIYALLAQAIVCLIGRPQMCNGDDIPEVLHLDLIRIVKMQNDVQKYSILGALSNVARQFLYTKGISWPTLNIQEMEELVSREDIRLPQIQDSFILLIQGALSATGQLLSQDETGLLKRMVERTTRPGDRTFSLIQKRVENAVFERCTEKVGERPFPSDGSSMSTGTHTAASLEAVQVGIQSLGKRTSDLVSHLLHVHGDAIVTMTQSL